MFYFKTPDTKVLTPLEDSEIIAECPICGKYFEFPELWDELSENSHEFDMFSMVWCDDCSAKSAKIRRELENAGLSPNWLAKHSTVISDIVKATA